MPVPVVLRVPAGVTRLLCTLNFVGLDAVARQPHDLTSLRPGFETIRCFVWLPLRFLLEMAGDLGCHYAIMSKEKCCHE